jgi:hypothetical protein
MTPYLVAVPVSVQVLVPVLADSAQEALDAAESAWRAYLPGELALTAEAEDGAVVV